MNIFDDKFLKVFDADIISLIEVQVYFTRFHGFLFGNSDFSEVFILECGLR